MRILGASDASITNGIEYYDGGIFEFGNTTTHGQQTVSNGNGSLYVDTFDWRNRHGKNWMTPVKDQGNSGYCAAFTAISCLEAYANLYYNQKIDMDLSEQEAACCNGTDSPYYGMIYYYPLQYIRNHGVCDEMAYPFTDDPLATCQSDMIIPNELVRISGYQYLYQKTEDNIKNALMRHGPMVSGFHAVDYSADYLLRHAMALVGYGTIHAGDSIKHLINYGNPPVNHGLAPVHCIQEGDPRIGKTYWIFKNSYINGGVDNDQYMYILFDKLSQMITPYFITGSITSMNYTDTDIICEDADGDGFYYWGIGPKPSCCPAGVPDEPDGDDSNPLLGVMDEYGNLESLNPDERNTMFISSDLEEISAEHIYNHMVVMNNATWKIRNSILFHNGAELTIKSGSTLHIKGGTLNKAKLNMEIGSSLIIEDGGVLTMPERYNFEIPYGCKLLIDEGQIK